MKFMLLLLACVVIGVISGLIAMGMIELLNFVYLRFGAVPAAMVVFALIGALMAVCIFIARGGHL